jgi:polyisoprenoid-binding protein YceI
MRPLPWLSCAAALLLAPTLAAAAPRTLPLAPPNAALAIRAYGMGFMPLEARFARFTGTLTYDPAQHGQCVARLTAQVDSITTDNAAIRDTMLSAEFLDAARFPTLSFTGVCTSSDAAEGHLTLRGVTHPLDAALEWTPHGLVTKADIRRALWGMDARPLMVGPVIRIRLTAALP